MRIITRQRNRRLYDTSIHRLVGLKEIGRLVAKNEPFKVICKKTKLDITESVLLSTAFLVAEKSQCKHSLDALKKIIQTGRVS